MSSVKYSRKQWPLWGYLLPLFLISSCTAESNKSAQPFDATTWQMQEDNHYPYRPAMADSVLYSKALRLMDSTALVNTLGPPDRQNDGHLYYLIEEQKLGWWTLSATFIVIKLTDAGKVAWIKKHG